MGLQRVAEQARKVPGPRMLALDRPAAHWGLSVYPTAAEAGGCFTAPRRHVWVPAGAGGNSERARQEAARRARAKMRRYCAANRLNKLGTLTYRGVGCHDPAQARADAGEFFRALRAGLGDRPLPYVWVPEWHKTDHGLHLHFAIGRYVRKSLIERAWGRGFVHIRLLGDLPTGSGPRDEARRAAGYLSKYVSKTFAEPDKRVPGMHRYDCAQGYQPATTRLVGRSADDVVAQANALLGASPVRQWSSAEVEDWQGPPAIWVQWA